VGLGPLFILCLAFNKTKALFEKWLMYGLATLFSLAMLSFISAIVLQVTLRAATALWATNFVNGLLKTSSEGLSNPSLEQGGIGLLMTVLIISVPPMAGNFFQGTLGQFYFNSAFSQGGGNRQGPNGQMQSGMRGGGHGPSQVASQSLAGNQGGTRGFNSSASPMSPNDPRLGGAGYSAASDTMKQGK
jgi:type IV secretion system protein VirB6